MNPARIAALVVAAACGWSATAAAAPPEFSPQEKAAVLLHGPWPPPLRRDASNRLSGRPAAVAFGRQLFSDPRLSTAQDRSCASCHDPARAFSDGLPLSVAGGPFARNTPSLLDARFQRWQGWAGASDSLWAASLRPLSDAAEMGASERVVAQRVRQAPDLAAGLQRATGQPLPADDDRLLADIGKALAAWQETLVSPRTPFDDFRDAMARGDWKAMRRYPEAAQRGLKLFVGSARCALCHSGPQFTHGEFDHAGIAVRKPDGRVDWGRYDGVKALRASRFNLLSVHNDDRSGRNAAATRHVALDPQSYGAFRVPGLRGTAHTAPYMHDGSLPTLESVVRHYAALDAVKLHIAAAHAHPEPGQALPPRPAVSLLTGLALDEAQIRDLVAFVQTLSAPAPVATGR